MELNFERLERRYRGALPTLRYWMEVEVHVYAFSVAANVLLSFFPFLIVLVSMCRYGLRWRAAEQAIYLGLHDYFPGATGDFLIRNLSAAADKRGLFQWLSLLLLLFTANGVFEPLEVALNRAWGITKERSFVKNQLVSFALIFACGGLAVTSTLLTAMNADWVRNLVPSQAAALLTLIFFKAAAVPATILILFLVYWVLPNGPVPRGLAFRTAIYVGLALEAFKYLNLLLWPWLRSHLEPEYGPFVNSATILLLSFVAALIVMAGAEYTAREMRDAAMREIE